MVINKSGEQEIFVNAVCPGPCRSQLRQHFGAGVAEVAKAVVERLTWKSYEERVRTYATRAIVERAAHGRFLQYKDIIK